MNELLKPGQQLFFSTFVEPCTIIECLGGGTQGEVYQIEFAGRLLALKWYFPEFATAAQREIIKSLIARRSPYERFLWPELLVSPEGTAGFGYLMRLRERGFCGLNDLMMNRVDASFRALATAGLELSQSFWQLHCKGLCYCDINFGNIFFDPDTGNILICDNDNIGITGQTGPGVSGTLGFMAPEIVRGESPPNADSDLFSLAVLLFHLFMIHHPLEGRREADIVCLDLRARMRLYGYDPLFIFDPVDNSNEPLPGIHQNALLYWPLYPRFFRRLFIRSFTDGLRDPLNGRVRETEWRDSMIRLRDAIFDCACGSENFWDEDTPSENLGRQFCWQCKQAVKPPPRLCFGKQHIVMLNHDTRIYNHHVDPSRSFEFSNPVAEVIQNPHDPKIWGLRNLTGHPWKCITMTGQHIEIPAGRSVSVIVGTRIDFGCSEAQIL